jgi:hypothetical protein
MPPLRVLIADDHQLFAETLGLILDFDGPLSPEDARQALTASAAAFLSKGCSAEQLVGALLEACVFGGAADTESKAAPLHQVAQP